MLPERANEIATEKNVLTWFGLGGREGLFPCPPDFQIVENTIRRAAIDEVGGQLRLGKKLVLVHGGAGCGKTTLLQQVPDVLPKSSVCIHFDCFGGGRYLYSDDKRHLPENAYLQLSNDVATTLKIPFFIPRNTKNPATIQSFIAKLHQAAKLLTLHSPEAFLVVIIDAADNSVSAANNATPAEISFVNDMLSANLSEIPNNVRFILSCRTGRRSLLKVPSSTAQVRCQSFLLEETGEHLKNYFFDPSDELVEQFHYLSNQNPRVQTYAIAAAERDETRLLAVLRPGGKSLADVLRITFQEALEKLGEQQLFNKIIGALSFLPPPISNPSLARLTGCAPETIRDLALDISPGLRIDGDDITVADEDFASFLTNSSLADRPAIIAAIADDMHAHYDSDPYSSMHVADFLVATGRATEVLSVIESDPRSKAIGDPVTRRQTQVRRFRQALAACEEQALPDDAIKTVLLSAEAERDDDALNEFLESNLDLAVEFSGGSLQRRILFDSDRVKDHGSFLTQDAARAARIGDKATARERLSSHNAWLGRRRQAPNDELSKWTVSDHDIAARVETALLVFGPQAATWEMRRWSPRDLPVRISLKLVIHLIAAGKADLIKSWIEELPPPRPWDLLAMVPLAMAGEPMKKNAVGKSLELLRQRYLPKLDRLDATHTEDRWETQLLETFLRACELGYSIGVGKTRLTKALRRLQARLEQKESPYRLGIRDTRRLDGLLRCYLLRKALTKTKVDNTAVIEYLRSLAPHPAIGSGKRKAKKKRQSNQNFESEQEKERFERKVQAILPAYFGRLEILTTVRQGQSIKKSQLESLGKLGLNTYELDHDYDSSRLRVKAATSVMALLFVEGISAKDFLEQSIKLCAGRFSDAYATDRQLIWRLMSLRNKEAALLIQHVSDAVEEVKAVRTGSSEKLDAIAQLLRLILPVSPNDAQVLFTDALEIAKEIDHEAFDQIDFLATASKAASSLQLQERRKLVFDIAAFVSGVAERLSDDERFSWNAAVNALSRVDPCVALACIGRWADSGLAKLEDTLDRYLVRSLERDVIDPTVVVAFLLLSGGPDEGLRKELMSRLMSEKPEAVRALEELCRQQLLYFSQNTKRETIPEIVDQLPSARASDGQWLRKLKNTYDFFRELDAGVSAEPEYSTAPVYVRRSSDDPEIPKEFSFDPKGRIFVKSVEIEEVLNAARNSGLRYDERDLLKSMREAAGMPRDRVEFLDALVGTDDSCIWPTYRAAFLAETLTMWQTLPSVRSWCQKVLPNFLIQDFPNITRWLKEGHSEFLRLLALTNCGPAERLRLLLVGVSRSGDTLGSRAQFAIAEETARLLDQATLGRLLQWYARRLRKRLPAEDTELHGLDDCPYDVEETAGRFLYAIMSDIDTRLRWKAAHTLRILARQGCRGIVTATIAQAQRCTETSFRDPISPFYFLAARLWLVIAVHRISAETPATLVDSKDPLYQLATSTDIPHVAVFEYSKRSLLKLQDCGLVSLNDDQMSILTSVNQPDKGEIEEKKNSSFRSFEQAGGDNRRFRFDWVDTLPYWYEDILRIFPTVEPNTVLDMAERWIVDCWGAGENASWWDKEPRKRRYDEGRFALWSNHHGSTPIVERHSKYLEWHAMYCVVGELLKSYPISVGDEFEYGSFKYWLKKGLPTYDSAWLSDNRGPTPLERRMWAEDRRSDTGWLHNLNVNECLAELGIQNTSRLGWIVANGHYTVHFGQRETTVGISSALVDPDTGASLARALQTISNTWDYVLPRDDVDREIDDPPYRLLGWLADRDEDSYFDSNDPLSYDIGNILVKPGKLVTDNFDLEATQGLYYAWKERSTGADAVVYEAWCDESVTEGEYYRRRIRSNGYRLWVRADIVSTILAAQEIELIWAIEVDRRLKSQTQRYSGDDEKRKRHHKILRLQEKGSVVNFRGRRIASWSGAGQGARSRSRS